MIFHFSIAFFVFLFCFVNFYRFKKREFLKRISFLESNLSTINEKLDKMTYRVQKLEKQFIHQKSKRIWRYIDE
jgi:hypothetical protein